MRRFITFFSATVMAISFSLNAWAAVEWQVLQEFKTPVSPLDVATSPDGKLTFVLGESSRIFVYGPGGVLRDTFTVEMPVDNIEVIKDGKNLLLTNKKTKQVQVISVAFQAEINVNGSPFQGKAEAPIVIAVFSDFQ